MSENNHEELFKTTLMGGFDKDDVMTKVQNLKDQAYAAQKRNTRAISTIMTASAALCLRHR